MSNVKHHWDKKHKPSFNPTAPKSKEEAQEQFTEALSRAAKNPANGMMEPKPSNNSYMMKDGVPHKFKNGIWTPLTKMS